MPRRSRGPRLWLRPPRHRAGRRDSAVWIIRDGGRDKSTGCSAGERGEAEKRLASYIAAKYAPERRERDISEIPLADVITIYLRDVAPGQARPEKAAERCDRLLDFFGEKMLDFVTGESCRAYAQGVYPFEPRSNTLSNPSVAESNL